MNLQNKITIKGLTDTGMVREKNEDAIGYDSALGLVVLADGMGGHRGGEIASQLAVDTVIKAYFASEDRDVVTALSRSLLEANRAIIDRSHGDVELFGMGTTCTTMVLTHGEAYFAHVGDSRAYVLRNGEITQLTEDHSLVGEMVRSGILSDEDAQHHPKRNVITRSLGTSEDLAADFPASPYKVLDGDLFLLCSDGLTALVSDEEVGEILTAHEPKEACQALVDSANNKGGKDNITVQVVKVHRL